MITYYLFKSNSVEYSIKMASFTKVRLNNAVATMSITTKMIHRDDFFQEIDKTKNAVCAVIPGAYSFYQIPGGSVFYFPENRWLVDLMAIYMISVLDCLPIKFCGDSIKEVIKINRSNGTIQSAFCSQLSGLVFSEKRNDFKMMVNFDPDDTTTTPTMFSCANKNVLLSDTMKINDISELKITVPKVSDKIENNQNKQEAKEIEEECSSILSTWISKFNEAHSPLKIILED
jgi:hypothetical protein